MAKFFILTLFSLNLVACRSWERQQENSRIQASSSQDIGPHDEPLRVTFMKGKDLALGMISGFDPELLLRDLTAENNTTENNTAENNTAENNTAENNTAEHNTAEDKTDEVVAWISKNQENMYQEVNDSPLHYVNTEAVVCAATGLASRAPIVVFVDACLSNSRPSVVGAAKLLIHEAVHHFGYSGDSGELFADSVAERIVEAWKNGGEVPKAALRQHWSPLPFAHAPAARIEPVVLWLGNGDAILDDNEGLFVWGGRLDEYYLGPAEMVEPRVDGGFYREKTRQWQTLTQENVPSPRVQAAAVAMGSRAFIWGGAALRASKSMPEMFHYPVIYGDGKIYDPRIERWSDATDIGAPSPRYGASAVWTGAEVIVWGGAWTQAENSNEAQRVFADGAIYNPDQGTWRPLSAQGAPDSRFLHAAVWTGQEMIIWGGARVTANGNGEQEDFFLLKDGAIYNPQTDTWRRLPVPTAMGLRTQYSAVWSGAELIIFGGERDLQDKTQNPLTGENYYCHGDGFAFAPKTNLWRKLSAEGSPGMLCGHTAIWTGESMLVWGGYRKLIGHKERSGYNYDPTTDRWNQVALQNSPDGDYLFASPSYAGKVHFWGGAWQKFAFIDNSGVETKVLAPGLGFVLHP